MTDEPKLYPICGGKAYVLDTRPAGTAWKPCSDCALQNICSDADGYTGRIASAHEKEER